MSPLYEYECPKHPGIWEFLIPPDSEPFYCRACGAEMVRIVSRPGKVDGGFTPKFHGGSR